VPNNLLEAALEYAARGWPVFPCRTNKTPRTENGVYDATTDPAKIREWWERWPGANVAVNCGEAGLLVLDYDPGSDPDALADILPEPTMVSRTPRGGCHEFYELPRDAEPVACSANRVAPHIDVRCFGGYVLLPPSATKDGSYEWEKHGAIPTAPEALQERARANSRQKDAHRDDWIIEPDLAENIDAAEIWLKTEAKPAIQGHGGDNTTYATAAMMKSYGLSAATALEVMWDCWNERCNPPWDYEDLARKVENGYAYNTSPPGNITQAYRAAATARLFQPQLVEIEKGVSELRVGRFRIIDRAGLDHVKPPEWLIPDFLPEGGYGLLVGAPGSFKTFVALDAALTVAGGGPYAFLGEERRTVFDPPKKPGPVLYMAGEGRPGLRQRVRAWESFHNAGRPVNYFDLADPVPRILDGGEAADELIKALLDRQPEGYRLIVLDTVGRSMQGTNENAQENASAFTALVERLQRGLGAAVLALHHTGHDNAERGRGSSVFTADADTTVILGRPKPGSLFARMTMTKQKDATEWDEPRWIEAKEIRLGMDSTSLAVARAKKQEVTASDPKLQEQEAKEARSRITLAMVDERALAVLKTRPNMELSQSHLADLIESHVFAEDGTTLGIQSRRINDWLKEIRASTEAKARTYWHAEKRMWRYTPT
jgi:hypothetical protein